MSKSKPTQGPHSVGKALIKAQRAGRIPDKPKRPPRKDRKITTTRSTARETYIKMVRVDEDELKTVNGGLAVMRRITAAALRGEIPLQAATKVAYLVDKIINTEMEIEKLKLMNDLERQPFIGLMLRGPKQPVTIEQDMEVDDGENDETA